MSENRILSLVYDIFASIEDEAQLTIFYNHVAEFKGKLDNMNVLECGFRQDEIALVSLVILSGIIIPDGKIKMIKARRERTGESLTAVVPEARKLFAQRNWQW
jgi:hypothetical protein